MKKRVLSVVLALCMVLALLPTVAMAAGPSVPTVGGKKIYANGAYLLLEDGATSNYTKVSYKLAKTDTSWAVLSGYENIDLSRYMIFGGTKDGTFDGDSNITINGGKVGSVYGGNGSESSTSNLAGNVTIVMNGGSVERILVCGYGGPVGGEGTTVSVTIHGGTVRGGVDESVNLESRNSAATTSLLIDGGTINGTIAVKKTGGSFVIQGGSILGSIKTGTNFNSSPANSVDDPVNVCKTTLTLMEDSTTPLANTAVSALTTNAGYTYGMNDVQTDADGKLYVYLPKNTSVTAAKAGSYSYENSTGITTTADGTAAGSLTKVIRASLSDSSYESGSLSVYFNNPGGSSTTLMAAAYDAGKMVDLKAATSTGGKVEFALGPDYRYKIFALDPDTYAPLCATAESNASKAK